MHIPLWALSSILSYVSTYICIYDACMCVSSIIHLSVYYWSIDIIKCKIIHLANYLTRLWNKISCVTFLIFNSKMRCVIIFAGGIQSSMTCYTFSAFKIVLSWLLNRCYFKSGSQSYLGVKASSKFEGTRCPHSEYS